MSNAELKSFSLIWRECQFHEYKKSECLSLHPTFAKLPRIFSTWDVQTYTQYISEVVFGEH